MRSKLDPTAPLAWQASYQDAEKRRRRAGWRRSDELRTPSKKRRRVDPNRLLAVAMGVAALVVVLSMVIPT